MILKEFVAGLPVSGKEEGWQCIERHLYSGKGRSGTPTSASRVTVVCLAVFIALAAVFRIPVVQAWSARLILTYREILPGRVRNFITVIAPEVKQGSTTHEDVSVSRRYADAFGDLSFSPLVLSGQEAGWSLEEIEIKRWTSGRVYILLEYRDREGNKARLAETSLDRADSTLIHYDQDEATLTKHTVRGVEVAILTYDDGPTYAWWYEQGLSLSLTYTGDSDATVAFLEALTPYAKGGR